jgi:hypothetical protein
MAYNKKDKMPEGFLTGILYFGSVHHPSNKFNQNKYVLQLMLEGAELEKAKKYNLNVKAASQHVPGPHVEVKRMVKGPQTKAPKVIDALNNDIPKTVLIGNGSKVKVKFGMYDNTKGKMGAYLDTVKVLNLVEFKPQSEDAQDFYAVEGDASEIVEPEQEEAQAPVQRKAIKPAVKVTSNTKLADDEIPF